MYDAPEKTAEESERLVVDAPADSKELSDTQLDRMIEQEIRMTPAERAMQTSSAGSKGAQKSLADDEVEQAARAGALVEGEWGATFVRLDTTPKWAVVTEEGLAIRFPIIERKGVVRISSTMLTAQPVSVLALTDSQSRDDHRLVIKLRDANGKEIVDVISAALPMQPGAVMSQWLLARGVRICADRRQLADLDLYLTTAAPARRIAVYD